MTSETSLTGRQGKLEVENVLVARLKKWDVSETLASKSEWGDSDSAGYTNRAPGRMDGTFATEGVYDTLEEQFDIFAIGDIVESVLWMNITTLYWAFPRALCMDFKLSVNVDTEEVIGWTADFGADGIFYRPGQTDAPSHTLPA